MLKTAGLFSGTPSTYTVGRTHITNATSLPNVPFDTLVINADNVYAFYPLSANTVIIAGTGSIYGFGGSASLDLGIIGAAVTHNIAGDLRIEGGGAHLEVAEDTVHVGGDLYTSLGGTVGMNGSGLLDVAGSTLFGGGSQIGLMTTGTLQVGSGITQQAFSSPSSFRMDGTILDLPVGPAHVINIETPDSSWLPDLSGSGAATLSLILVGRARVAGGVSSYGLSLSGDTLVTDGQLSSGTAGLSVTLKRYEGPVFYQFQNVTNWTVSTTQFTGDGGLPYSNNFAFDTLIVSANVQGQLSQLLTANYIEVTGPGNPRHIGGSVGVFGLSGGDGNTTVNVTGDVLVSGAGATINNNRGILTTTGDLLVQQGGLLVATATGCCGTAQFDIGGNATFNGASTRDSLTGGRLRIGKDFAQGGPDPESFVADSGFITQFMGGGTHRVSFLNPGPAGSGLSHFGELQTDVTLPTELALYNSIFLSGRVISVGTGITFTNAVGTPLELSTAKLDLTQATFNDVTLHWNDPTGAPLSEFQFDNSSFAGFQPSEDQFVIEATATLGQPVTATNITFSPLGGTDTGHYVRVIDTDSPLSTRPFIIVNTANSTDPAVYFEAVNGAVLSIFAWP